MAIEGIEQRDDGYCRRNDPGNVNANDGRHGSRHDDLDAFIAVDAGGEQNAHATHSGQGALADDGQDERRHPEQDGQEDLRQDAKDSGDAALDAEVDSELIFRLADRFAPEGPIDREGLKKALALCRGQMSAVLVSRLDPGTITVLKGNKPLCLRIHRQHRVVLYASDDAFIDFAVDNEKGWRELEVPPMTMLTIRHEDVRAIENSEFRFIPQERKGTLPEGVNA